MGTKFLVVEKKEDRLQFKLGNGLLVEINPADLTGEIREAAMYHGLNQKVRDAAAGFSKETNFSGAFGAMQQVVDNLLGGRWNAKGGNGTSDLAQAVANLKGIELSEAQELINGLDDWHFAELAKKPKVKAEIARIKAERAARLAEAEEDEDLGI